MSNEIYPTTKQFKKETEHLKNSNRIFSISKIRQIFEEIIGEYEHGTADVEDVENVNIKQYSAVAHDLILCLEHHYEPGEENES